MKESGIVRNVDNVGRIVIPMEIRKIMSISEGDPVEIVKENNQIIIDYFKEVWNISFYQFKEGKDTYSLCCGTQEGIKFIEIVKPYIESCPSMIYKIQYDLSQRRDYVE